MTDEPIPPRQSLSRLFLGGIVTTSVFCGALGGLAILFIGDTFFDKTTDPAIHFNEIRDDLERTQARIATLEQTVAATPSHDTGAIQAEMLKLKNKVTMNKKRTVELEKHVATIGNSATDTQFGHIVMGITQIKTAFDNDLPLQPGIDTLKSSFTDASAQKILNDLADIATSVPTIAFLSAEVKKLIPDKQAPIPIMTPPTWGARAKNMLSRFVSVRTTDIVTQETSANHALSALSVNDLPMARAALSAMPHSPAVEKIIAAIDTRLHVQSLVQKLVTGIAKSTGQSATGALY